MTLIKNLTPHELGFKMPAEWELHEATWTSYPADNELWFGHLEAVRSEHVALVQTIARFEKVHVLVRDEESKDDFLARVGSKHNIEWHLVPLDDVWFRDNGPLFITKGNEVAATKWVFNAWGEKFFFEKDNQAGYYPIKTSGASYWDIPVVMEGGSLEVNGQGLALTTKQCLLEPHRNPELSPQQIEQLLKDYLGIEKLLWLESGLENDHTDGHIDTITRFVGANTVITSITTDPTDSNFAPMQANLVALKTFTDTEGKPLSIVELPLPQNKIYGAEGRLPPTYANFYIGNGFVVMPTYNDPQDEAALKVLKSVFPEHEVIPLSSRAIIEGGGSFHCMTQQQPKGTVWKNA